MPAKRQQMSSARSIALRSMCASAWISAARPSTVERRHRARLDGGVRDQLGARRAARNARGFLQIGLGTDTAMLVEQARLGRLSIGVRLQDDLQHLLAQRVHVAMLATAFNARPGRLP